MTSYWVAGQDYFKYFIEYGWILKQQYAKHFLSVIHGDLQLEINFLLALLENLFFMEQLNIAYSSICCFI